MTGLSSTDGAGRERYEQIRDERILWVNVTTDELHAAYDVARDARDVDTAVRIAVQVFERNSKLLPDPELVALRERTRVLEEARLTREEMEAIMRISDHTLVKSRPAWKSIRSKLHRSLAAVAVEDGDEGLGNEATQGRPVPAAQKWDVDLAIEVAHEAYHAHNEVCQCRSVGHLTKHIALEVITALRSEAAGTQARSRP